MSIRLTNVGGRASLLVGDRLVDIERRSGGELPSDPMEVLARWSALREWASGIELRDEDPQAGETALAACVPSPAKVFGVGLNYKAHAAEAGLDIPKQPLIFTKFPSCIAGPRADVVLTGGRVDYEVELVVVIGRRGRHIPRSEALQHVAGYCVGQDVSDRALQFSDRPPQFSMGKSADTYGPIGPAVVSIDAFDDPDDLPICCEVNGEIRQQDRTSGMIFSVAELIEFLSRFCTLEPGDLVFTGTPAGIGSVRDPRVYLTPGDVITSTIDGIGTLRNRCVSA